MKGPVLAALVIVGVGLLWLASEVRELRGEVVKFTESTIGRTVLSV